MGKRRVLSLRQVISKSKGPFQYVTRLSGEIVWTNGYIVVRDDPIFIKYFGRGFLEKTVREGGLRFLDSARRKLVIGEYKEREDTLGALKRFFSQDLSALPQLSISEGGSSF